MLRPNEVLISNLLRNLLAWEMREGMPTMLQMGGSKPQITLVESSAQDRSVRIEFDTGDAFTITVRNEGWLY